jgi:hypothetical protein
VNESAREGLEALAERGEARGSTAVLDAARAAVRRRQARTRAVLAVGALLVVGLVAGMIATRDGGDEGREVVTQPGEEDGAPPRDDGPLSIFLSDTVLPTSGAEVITIVRNRGTEDWMYGQRLSIDRWTGTEWDEVGEDPPEGQAVLDVGLLAPAGGVGGALRVRIEPLDPGWYRLRRGAASGEPKATGVFRVVDRAVTTVDLTFDPQRYFTVTPALVTSAAGALPSTPLQLWPTMPDFRGPPGALDAAVDALDPGVHLAHWVDGAWQDVATVDVAADTSSDAQGVRTFALPPDLAPGAYRLQRTVDGADPITGYFFVVDDTAPESATDAPPADEGPVTLWLSDAVLPSSGADVVMVLHNRGSESPMFGVPTYLDRWDGGAWQEVVLFTTCVTGWHCIGDLDPATGWEDIGVPAPPGGYGGGEWVHVEGLDTGWYRFRKVANEGTTATGTFRVVDDAVTAVPIADRAGPILVLPPVVVPPAATVQAGVSVPSTGVRTAADLREYEASLDDRGAIERWTGADWDEVRAVDFAGASGSVAGAFDVDLSGLGPGPYRLVRTEADGTDIYGYFWVVTEGAPPTTTTVASADPATPPADDGTVTLFLSDTVLPASGADLVAILRNTGTESPTFGVGAFVDRWNGDSWEEQSPIATCLDFWFCVASLDAPDGIATIGLAAPPGGYGSTQWIHVDGLEPGWYRLRQVANEGTIATGTFQVVDRDVATIDFGDVTVDKLVVQPTVRRAGGACQGAICAIRIAALAKDAHTATDIDAFEASLDDGARLDRWTGDRWATVGELDFTIEARVDWTRQPGERLAALPQGLTPGAYRVIRTAPDGAEPAGFFFVEQPT